MKIESSDLHIAANWLTAGGRLHDEPGDEAARARVADWLRYVADQREEYEARKRGSAGRYPSLKGAMAQVWRARGVG